MLCYDTKYRVCYGDTDRMGVMYYGHYPRLYEIGRTDLIREIWKSYREVEESGIILPVRLLSAIYHKPAIYDEVLTIRTIIKEIPKVKFKLFSEIYNEKGELINEGEVVLGFIDASTGKPRRAPEEFTQILQEKMV
ncbi:MAG TPA: thioesterase family protein [Prolixibacteraceae bacterium]|nr:thioesterase family protein [Prolixibacteraceae bacterium]